MRFHYILLCAALAIIFSCASFKSGTVDAYRKIKIPQDFAGMVHAGSTKTDSEYAFLDEMGVSWILTTFYWSSIEPERGKWNFANYDSYVDAAKAHGKKVLVVLAYDTVWVHANGETRRKISPTELPDYVEFVAQTVAHFKGKVDAWQIWNEPNWIFWQGPKKDYYALAKEAAKKVREIDPDTPLLTGGILRAPGIFVSGLFKSGAMEDGSEASVHPYDMNPTGSAFMYDSFKKILVKNNYSGNVWVTEVGYPTGGLYPTRISEKKLGDYVIKTITLLAVRGARAIFWYQLFDPPREKRVPLDSEDFFGLGFPDYTLKHGAESYAVCVKNIAGKTYDPSYPVRAGISSSINAFYFEDEEQRGGKSTSGVAHNTLILWKSGGSVKLRLQIPESAQVFDSKTLTTTAISADGLITVRSNPVIVTWND